MNILDIRNSFTRCRVPDPRELLVQLSSYLKNGCCIYSLILRRYNWIHLLELPLNLPSTSFWFVIPDIPSIGDPGFDILTKSWSYYVKDNNHKNELWWIFA